MNSLVGRAKWFTLSVIPVNITLYCMILQGKCVQFTLKVIHIKRVRGDEV